MFRDIRDLGKERLKYNQIIELQINKNYLIMKDLFAQIIIFLFFKMIFKFDYKGYQIFLILVYKNEFIIFLVLK